MKKTTNMIADNGYVEIIVSSSVATKQGYSIAVDGDDWGHFDEGLKGFPAIKRALTMVASYISHQDSEEKCVYEIRWCTGETIMRIESQTATNYKEIKP